MFDYDYNCYEDDNEVKEKIDILQIHISQLLNFVFSNIPETFKRFKNLIKLNLTVISIFSPECGGDVAGSIPTTGIA